MFSLRKLLLASLIMIAGCDGSEDTVPGLFTVRFLHASPDAPRVNVNVRGPSGGELDLVAIDYKAGSNFIPIRLGEHSVQVETIEPDGNQVVIDVSNFAQAENTNHDIIMVGKVEDSSIEALLIENLQTQVSAGNFRVQVVHASPDAAEVLVYLTTPDVPLIDATPLGPLSFREWATPVENPAGNHQIRVALAADPLNAIFDSGSLPFVNGLDLLITMVNNTTTSDVPVTLVAQDGLTIAEMLNVDTPADLRFVHALPDAVALDVIIDDAMPPAVTGLEFTEFTDYLEPGLTPNIKVVDSPAPGTVVAIDTNRVLTEGIQHTLLFTGLFANVPLPAVLLADNNRRVMTEAKFRIAHASNIAGPVDVFVTPPGVAIGPDSFSIFGLPLGFDTGYASLAPGDYELTLTEFGDQNAVLIDAQPITVVAGGVYTVVAIDSAGGVAPVGLILMDDFATP